MPETVFLALGGNLGDPVSAFQQAIFRLQAMDDLEVVQVASLYRSTPVGPPNQPDFLNSALQLEAELEPLKLLEQLKRIERELGRFSGERWGPRPLDLDILLFGDREIDTPKLTIPHPRMTERAFVMRPLAELCPDRLVPGTGQNVQTLALRFSEATPGIWPESRPNWPPSGLSQLDSTDL